MSRAPAAERTPPPVMALINSPLGAPVRAFARIRASVHVKLLAGFLLITFLVIALTLVSLRTVGETARVPDGAKAALIEGLLGVRFVSCDLPGHRCSPPLNGRSSRPMT